MSGSKCYGVKSTPLGMLTVGVLGERVGLLTHFTPVANHAAAQMIPTDHIVFHSEDLEQAQQVRHSLAAHAQVIRECRSALDKEERDGYCRILQDAKDRRQQVLDLQLPENSKQE